MDGKLAGGKLRKWSRAGVWPYLFCAPFIIAYLAFSLYPTLFSFWLSLFNWSGIGQKVFFGVKNYVRLWTKDPLFFKSLLNMLTIMLMSIPFQISFGLLISGFLFYMKRGKQVYQTIAFLPYITAPVAIGFIFSYIYDWQHGYMNTILMGLGILKEPVYWLQTPFLAKLVVANMIVWRMTGYCTIIYLAGLTAIPTEQYDAATVDGAGPARTFVSVTLPQLRNISAFLIITGMISGLQLFDEAVMLYTGTGILSLAAVGGPDYSVLTVMWKFYDNSFKTTMALGYGASISYSLFLIIVFLSILSYRIITRRSDA